MATNYHNSEFQMCVKTRGTTFLSLAAWRSTYWRGHMRLLTCMSTAPGTLTKAMSVAPWGVTSHTCKSSSIATP